MKKVKFLIMILINLWLIGCATTFYDLKAGKNIRDGKIYTGMTKEDFGKIMDRPIFGIQNITTEEGKQYEVWDYNKGGFHSFATLYLFYFDEENKLVKWEKRSPLPIISNFIPDKPTIVE